LPFVLNKHGNLTGRAAAMFANHIVRDDPA
jgi:hypothetical protein